eukprot:gene16564-18894_t
MLVLPAGGNSCAADNTAHAVYQISPEVLNVGFQEMNCANNDATTTAIKPTWVLRFDGGSRGNPGLGGAGAAIYNYMTSGELNEIWRGYFFVGKTGITNNQAEYA